MSRWLQILWRGGVLGLLLTAGAAAAPVDPTTRTFEGWTATCNNLRACVAIATAQDDLFYVRIARDGGAEAAPEVKIVLAAQEPQKGRTPAFALTATTGEAKQALGPFPATTSTDDSSVLSATIPAGAASAAFIAAIKDADSLSYAVLGNRGSLDLKGLAAALRFLDAAQGRQGTPTALVARGMTPVGQVPAVPSPTTLRAAPAGSASVVDKPALGKAVMAAAAAVCDPDVVKDQSDAMAWKIDPTRMLVAVPCTQGAYNLSSALYTTNLEGEDPKPLNLPRPKAVDDDAAANVVVNASFDVKTMELTSLDKGRGLGDCGVLATWLWTGEAFQLLEASALEACPGALPEDWPSIYAAKRE